MAGKADSTDGTTSLKRKAVQAVAEVGGARSSDDPAPDLWFGECAGERRGATCSAEVKSSKGRGNGPRGLPAPEKARKLQITLYRKAKFKPEYRFWNNAERIRNSESRMRENRPSGLMRGGKMPVIGFAFHPVSSRLLYP